MTRPRVRASGDEAPTLGVCVVTWNSAEWIEACLRSILDQARVPEEIVVVDNASTDATAAAVRAFAPDVTLVENERNEGFSAGVNRGIAATTGKYFATINPDVVLEPSFFAELVDVLETSSEAAMASPCLLREAPREGRVRVDSLGLRLGGDRRGADVGRSLETEAEVAEWREAWAPCGAAGIWRRSVLEALAYDGGEVFDEAFFCYKEDVDLGWRANRLGFRSRYVPSARARHDRGWREGGRAEIPREIRLHSRKNRYLMMVKNETALSFLAALPPILWFEIRALVYSLFFEPGLLRVYPAVFRHLPEAWRKRRWLARRIREAR